MEQCRGGCSNEMVNSSAAAAILRSQDVLNVCENCTGSSEFGKRTEQRGSLSRKSKNKICIKCGVYQLDVGTSCSEMIERITRNYLASYENNNINGENTATIEKRTRKQQRPQKVLTDDIKTVSKALDQSIPNRIVEIRERYMAQLVSSKGLLKCYRCSRYASARASSWVPYHTRASLALHNLWRHSRTRVRRMKRESHVPGEPRSVTLRATVYTQRADAFRGVR